MPSPQPYNTRLLAAAAISLSLLGVAGCGADTVTIPGTDDGGGTLVDGAVVEGGGGADGTADGASKDGGAGCPGADKVCGGQCVANDDPRYGCGVTGCAPCGANQVCNHGACAGSCSPGLTNCSGACVDPTMDPQHCGNCTTACAVPPNGQATCSAGTCGITCDAGFNECGGKCAANGPLACGASCTMCPTVANGVATCSTADQCGYTCNTGHSVCASGCCTDDVSDSYSGGSRLKAKWLVTSDGTGLFVGWHDTLLDMDCGHIIAGDGQLRCVPYAGLYVGGDEFVDPSCTQPLAAFAPGSACSPLPSTMQAQDGTTCPGRTHVYSVGAQVSAQHYFRNAATHACVPYSGSSQLNYYAEGPEIGPSSFLSSTLQNGPVSGGVVPVYQQGADGSIGFYGWTDATSSQGCYFWNAADGQLRCLPASTASFSSDFADPSCTTDAYLTIPTACPDPGIGMKYDTSCPTLAHVVSLGAKLPGIVYTSSAGVCTATTVPKGEDWYAGGGEIAPNSYAAASQSAPTGSARIQEIDLVTGGGLVEAEGFYDSKRAETCGFGVAGDGEIRCMPGAMSGGYFSDSLCTQPVGLWFTSTCAATPKYVSTYDPTTCPARSHVFPVVSPLGITTAYYLASGQCYPISSTAYEFFSFGAELAPTTFQSATQVLK